MAGHRIAESAFDVLGLGCVAVDDLLYVDAYPSADRKVQVLRRERQCGGLTATALVAAARLGSRCAYGGVLGRDVLSAFVLGCLGRESINITHTVRRAGARPIYSVVVVDIQRQTRNIFYDLQGVVGADTAQPAADIIRSTRVLFVDPCGLAGMIRAAHIARADDIPIVADFEGDAASPCHELLGLVDHLIVSRDFAAQVTGEADPAVAAVALWADVRNAVVVTCGREGCWYLTDARHSAPEHCPAYTVETVDTTGCGDVFHGAYAAALAQGLDLPERVRLASAAAALKATYPGGQVGIPTRSAVETFMKEQHT